MKNGLEYVIEDISPSSITFKKLDKEGKNIGEEMFMPNEDVSDNLLLSYAKTYHKTQGKTEYGTIRLAQTDAIHFSHRHLIVGIGRAPEGTNVQVM